MKPTVSCTRCGGFIVSEAFRDIGLCSIGWHCLVCGEIVDRVILRNRMVPSIPSPMDEEPTNGEQSSESDECSSRR